MGRTRRGGSGRSLISVSMQAGLVSVWTNVNDMVAKEGGEGGGG